MKLRALVAAALMVASSTALAYDTDDWGFPVEGSYSVSQASRSYSSRGFSRPVRLFRNVTPSFVRTAPARPATQQVVRVAPVTRVIASRPVAAPAPVAAAPAAPTQVSVRPTATQQR